MNTESSTPPTLFDLASGQSNSSGNYSLAQFDEPEKQHSLNRFMLGYALALVASMVFGSLFSANAQADSLSSINYRIDWEVVDAGGIAMGSANYAIIDSPAQATPLGEASSASYALTEGFLAAPDTDTDSVRDFLDNCTLDPNSSQLDTNGDGFGNFCDPDLDNNGAVNFIDYAQLTAAFLSTPGDVNWNPDADLTGDGIVNFIDIARFQLYFLGSPGPSGIN